MLIYIMSLFKNRRSLHKSNLVDLWRNRSNLAISSFQILTKSSDNKNAPSGNKINTDSNWYKFINYLSNLNLPPFYFPDKNPSFYENLPDRFYVSQNKGIIKTQAPPKSADDFLTFATKNPNKGLGINLTRFEPKDSFIVCDIDKPRIGKQIIDLINKGDRAIVPFNKVFDNPVVIQTPTTGHLHLWYKAPEKDLMKSKLLCCSVLGLPVEYIFENIELYSKDRFILQSPSNFQDISQLPIALYPYSYIHKPGYKSLAEGTPFQPNIYPGFESIPEGRRNSFLFNHFRVDNFNRDIALMANEILCDPPLPMEDVVKSFVNTHSRLKPDSPIKAPEMRKPYCNFHAVKSNESKISFRVSNQELEEQNPDELPDFSGLKNLFRPQEIEKLKRYEYSPSRALNALDRNTPFNTLSLVAFLEQKHNMFYDREIYEGKQAETFVLHLFLKEYKYQDRIIYETESNRWYKYNGKFWELCEPDTIDGFLQRFISKHINFGGLETRFSKNSAYRSLLQNQVSKSTWPSNQTIGLPFQNGIIVANEDKGWELKEHSPLYYHRYVLPCNFDKAASLSLIQVRFLLDICGEQIAHLNVLRFVLFLIISSTNNQVGIYLNSEAGGSKSSFVRLIQEIFRQAVIPLNVDELKKGNVFQNDYAANAKVLVISEIPKSGGGHQTVRAYAKSKLGGDPESAAKKHGKFYKTNDIPVIIFVSNHPSNEMPLFEDEALIDRIVDFKSPKIGAAFKHHDIEKYVAQNLQGLLNWAIQLQIDIVQRFVRVKDLNYELMTDYDPMSEFVLKQLVLVPNPTDKFHGNSREIKENKLNYASILFSKRDLNQSFREFLNEGNYSEFVKKKYDSDFTIKRDFESILDNRLIDIQQGIVTQGRTSEARGYYNVTTKARILQEISRTAYGRFPRKSVDEQAQRYVYIGRKQYALLQTPKLNYDQSVRQMINKDPFLYSGIITNSQNSPVLIQTNPNAENTQLRENAYLAAGEVSTSSCKVLLKMFPQQSIVSYNKNVLPNGLQNQASALVKSSNSNMSKLEFEQSIPAIQQNYKVKEPIIYYTPDYNETALSVPLPQNKLKESNLKQTIFATEDPRKIYFTTSNTLYMQLYFVSTIDKVGPELVMFKLPEDGKYPIPSDAYIIEPNDPISNTMVFDDSDEMYLKITIRLAIKAFISLTKSFPATLEQVVATVLYQILMNNIKPIMLFVPKLWYNFMVEDFPMYKRIIDHWFHDDSDFFYAMEGYADGNDSLLRSIWTEFKPVKNKEQFELYCAVSRKAELTMGVDSQNFSFTLYDKTKLPSIFKFAWEKDVSENIQTAEVIKLLDTTSVETAESKKVLNEEETKSSSFKIENQSTVTNEKENKMGDLANSQKTETNLTSEKSAKKLEGETQVSIPDSNQSQTPKRRRGRPPGSSNKPKNSSKSKDKKSK